MWVLAVFSLPVLRWWRNATWAILLPKEVLQFIGLRVTRSEQSCSPISKPQGAQFPCIPLFPYPVHRMTEIYVDQESLLAVEASKWDDVGTIRFQSFMHLMLWLDPYENP